MQAHYSLQKLINFRRSIHQQPQAGFQEFQTKSKIINFLKKEIGISQQSIRQVATTGLVVDLRGKDQSKGSNKTIAFRADIDALTMTQHNPHLSYMSKRSGYAHMCGHDGHTACLVAFAWKYFPILKKIPSNKTIRLIFQPSEQGPISGAKKMISENVLLDVDQIYGFHNWPNDFPGKIYIKQGPVMAQGTQIKIKVTGTKGHGSTPELVKDAVGATVKLYQTIMKITNQLKKNGHNFVCSLPFFHGGERINVFSQECLLQGTIRSFEAQIASKIIEKIVEKKNQLQNQGYKVQFFHSTYAPVNHNSKKQAQHVQRVAKMVYGEKNVSSGILPIRASEDFAFFTQKIPGAFFFATSGRVQNSPACHSNNYDFNDELIQQVSELWLRLAIDRVSEEK